MNIKREVKPVKESELPQLADVLIKEMGIGTIFTYPEKEIVFPNSKQSPVKSLKVNIVSTDSKDLATLHKLHTSIWKL